MDVLTGPEGLDEHRVPTHVRQQAELDLRVVSRDQHVPRCGHEGPAHLPPEFRTNGDILQIRVAAAESARLGDGLIERRVNAPGLRMDHLGQGIHIGRFHFAQLPIVQNKPWQVVLQGQVFQDGDVR